MRLSLHCHRHWPEQPQLLADLSKIFSPEQLPQLLDAVTAGGCLLTARFNERELAGALLEVNAPQARLSLLQVREVTRRRGVGRFLLDEARQLAADAGAAELQLLGVVGEEAQAFAQACGFQPPAYRLALTKASIKPSSASSPD